MAEWTHTGHKQHCTAVAGQTDFQLIFLRFYLKRTQVKGNTNNEAKQSQCMYIFVQLFNTSKWNLTNKPHQMRFAFKQFSLAMNMLSTKALVCYWSVAAKIACVQSAWTEYIWRSACIAPKIHIRVSDSSHTPKPMRSHEIGDDSSLWYRCIWASLRTVLRNDKSIEKKVLKGLTFSLNVFSPTVLAVDQRITLNNCWPV